MPELLYEPTVRTNLRPVSEGGGIFGFGDTLRGVASGVEGFGRSVVGLADLATGGDVIPDSWSEDRWIDRPTTLVGGLAEGLTQFGIGFYTAGLGWAGKAGVVARGITAAQKAGKIGEGVATALRVGANVVQQSVADFVAFDGHEGRLSNLLESFPELKNPVTEYLAANKDDAELEGRLKNVVEGRLTDLGLAGVGRIFGLALKGYKKGALAFKRATDAGFDAEVALQIARDAAYDPKLQEEMALAHFDDAPDKVADSVRPQGDPNPRLDPAVWGTDADLKKNATDIPAVTQTAAEVRERSASAKAVASEVDAAQEAFKRGDLTEKEAASVVELMQRARPEIAPANVPIIRDFVSRIGKRLFGDLDVEFPAAIGAHGDNPVAGRMKFAERVVQIADEAIRLRGVPNQGGTWDGAEDYGEAAVAGRTYPRAAE